MTFLELQNEVAYRVGNSTAARSNGTELVRTKAAINQAQREICMMQRWPFLLGYYSFATVASTETYALPWNIDEVFEGEIEPTADYPEILKLVSPIEARSFSRSYAGSTGLPEFLYVSDMTTSAYHSAGTITLTHGSAAVAGVATAFTAAMVGKWLRVKGDIELYKIKTFTNVTTLALDRPYGGTSAALLSYEIDPPGCEQVALLPIANDAYTVTLFVKNRCQELVNDTDYSIIPMNYSEVIVLLSVIKMKRALGNIDTSTDERSYFNLLNAMRASCRHDHGLRYRMKNLYGNRRTFSPDEIASLNWTWWR
ncbi:MAG: hypothetical protein WC505_07235 [Patescibacteria group bacterium]